jgi:hypothetical protein
MICKKDEYVKYALISKGHMRDEKATTIGLLIVNSYQRRDYWDIRFKLGNIWNTFRTKEFYDEDEVNDLLNFLINSNDGVVYFKLKEGYRLTIDISENFIGLYKGKKLIFDATFAGIAGPIVENEEKENNND